MPVLWWIFLLDAFVTFSVYYFYLASSLLIDFEIGTFRYFSVLCARV